MSRSTFKTLPIPQRGFSFVEVLVTAAIVALVFGGLFAAVQSMVFLINDSKAKAGATALATERLEFIRSFEYDAVGTDGGVPAGTIPQYRTVTINDLPYQERVLIEYVDDPADGFGGADTNGILADFKRIKVEYSWMSRSGTSSVALVSTVVPQGIESTAGGGTIRVYVNDANVQPIAGASVRFVNDTGTSSIDTTRFTDATGVAYLGGAPALSDYEIYVSRAGYSNDGTAVATGTLSSPSQPVVSVVESAITTQYFQIDEVSDLTITTAASPTYGTFDDTFTDTTGIATTSTTTVVSDSYVLAGGAGSYPATGTVQSVAITPSPLESWYSLNVSASTSASTSVFVQLFEPVGTSSLIVIPDTDLPGNSSGFTTMPLDITALDATTYPELVVRATLTSRDANFTPTLHDWTVTHIATQPVLSGITMQATGAKVLGLDAVGAAIYKNVFSDGTDGSGQWELDDIEYDAYTVSVTDPTYDVLEVCPDDQITLAPGTAETVSFTIGSVAGSRLLVRVTDVGDTPIADATVRVQQGGYDQTQVTSLCGQTFFSGGLTAGTSTVTITKSGYTPYTELDVPVHSSSSIDLQIN